MIKTVKKSPAVTEHHVHLAPGHKIVSCGRCGMQGLHWEKRPQGNRLMLSNGEQHICFKITTGGKRVQLTPEERAARGAVQAQLHSNGRRKGEVRDSSYAPRRITAQDSGVGATKYEVCLSFGGRDHLEHVIADCEDRAVFHFCKTLADRFNHKQDAMVTWTPEGIYDLVRATARVDVMVGKLTEEQLADPDYGNPAFTEDDVFKIAYEIVPLVVTQFYPTNRSIYQRLQFDMQDVEQYLYERVLMGARPSSMEEEDEATDEGETKSDANERVRGFIPLIRKRPRYYRNLGILRKSFYIACKRACMAHYRMHVKSARRGDILRAQVLELNNDDITTVSLAGRGDIGYLERIKVIMDQCDCPILHRMIYLMAHERYDSKTALRKSFGLPRQEFEDAWARMEEYMEQWRHELTPPQEIAVHSVSGGRFRASGIEIAMGPTTGSPDDDGIYLRRSAEPDRATR